MDIEKLKAKLKSFGIDPINIEKEYADVIIITGYKKQIKKIRKFVELFDFDYMIESDYVFIIA